MGRLAGVLAFAAAAALLGLSPWRALERSWGLDTLYALRGTRTAPEEVMVVALNTQAARGLGVPARPDRWPRALHAELIERLHEQGAKLVAFDLLFDRPRDAADDARLSRSLRQAGNVVLVAYLQRELVPAGGGTASVDRLVNPDAAFASAALATAPFALVKSAEGVLEYLGFAPEGDDLPSLPLVLAAAQRPDGLAPLVSRLGPAAAAQAAPAMLEALRRQALADPAMASPGPDDSPATRAWRQLLTEPSPQILLNVYGPPGHLHTLSYDSALAALRQGSPEAARFRGRTVLVGLSESNQPEQRDVYRTPWSTRDGRDISGVELAATALANQLDGSALRRLPPSQEAALLALMAALLLAPWRLMGIRRALPCSLALAGGYAVAAGASFAQLHLWLPWALPLFIVWPASLLLGLGLGLRDTERQRRRLRLALDRYGPREEIAVLARRLRLRDDTVHVACMSTDIEDYTRRVEGRDPGEARRWLNTYYETVFPIVREHGGHVVDHAGDAMVCIWLCGNDPQLACRSAVAAARSLHARLNLAPADARDDPDAFPTRIGLHFGPVALGDVGDARHAEQRIVGDIVNTASRIQSANKALGTRMLVSDAVAAHLAAEELRPLGRFLLSGKARAVGLADPLPVDPRRRELHQRALQAWHEGRHAAAEDCLAELLAQWPMDGPSRFLKAQLASPRDLPHPGGAVTPSGDPPPFTLSLK